MSQDNYGYFGPTYSYADNIKLPGQIGVRKGSSFGAIFDAVGGVNHYMDIIAFGGPTLFDKQDTRPMGIRYFLNTEMRCSNGATMSEYMDGVTKGDLLGEHVAAGLASAGLPGLKGLAPGMLENARDALDPRPILSAVTATGYPVCQQVVCPVGDTYGSIVNAFDGTEYLADPPDYTFGYPTQTRWVQALDEKGDPINVTKGEYAANPKCYNSDGSYKQEPPEGCPDTEPAGRYTPITNRKHRKYGLCQQVRAPNAGREGFMGQADGNDYIAVGVSVALLFGVAVWSALRK